MLTKLHSQKKVTFWGKIHLTANFAVYLLLFENYICPFPKKLARHNSTQKKDHKAGNKTANKGERLGIRRAREKDRNRFAKKSPSPSPNCSLCACVKNKKLLN